MTKEVRHIVDTLRNNGFKCFLVGGWVRDKVLGVKSHDVDIATNAKPGDIGRMFLNDKTDFVGKSFGVSLVNGIEVATFRTDNCGGLSDKNVKVDFVSTIEEDLSRRDFTMNAVAFDPITEEFVDPFNGVADAEDNRLVFVGNPDERIFEDPCRILRALRFVARFELTIPIVTLDALQRNAHLVNLVPRERIRLEILKTLESAERPSIFFEVARRIGCLRYFLPSLDDCFDIDQNRHHKETIWEHGMLAGDFLANDNPLLCLAGFLHDVGKAYTKVFCEDTQDFRFRKHDHVGADVVERELRNLKFSNDEVELIRGLVDVHMRVVFGEHVKKSTTRRTLRKLNDINIPLDHFIRLRVADNRANLTKNDDSEVYERDIRAVFNEVLNEPPVFDLRNLTVNGQDVMDELHIEPGPTVGLILNWLFEQVLENPSLNTRGTLLDLIHQYYED